MWREHPWLGIGPDNFRLLKWKYMEIPRGDETILANSLYLEFLAGSGVFGLAGFLWVLWEIWRSMIRRFRSASGAAEAAAAGFGLVFLVGFVIHGVVDYFLKFTPTYLLFWVLVGSLCARAARQGEADADRI